MIPTDNLKRSRWHRKAVLSMLVFQAFSINATSINANWLQIAYSKTIVLMIAQMKFLSLWENSAKHQDWLLMTERGRSWSRRVSKSRRCCSLVALYLSERPSPITSLPKTGSLGGRNTLAASKLRMRMMTKMMKCSQAKTNQTLFLERSLAWSTRGLIWGLFAPRTTTWRPKTTSTATFSSNQAWRKARITRLLIRKCGTYSAAATVVDLFVVSLSLCQQRSPPGLITLWKFNFASLESLPIQK